MMPATPRIQNQRPCPDLPTMCVVRTGQDYGSTHPIRRVDDDDDDTTITTRNNLGMKQQKEQTLQRHLSLFDLVAVGIGATVGSGVFVLTGFVAHALSGPAVSCSWLVAGLAACLSGSCYAELGGRYPCVGSTYVYAKETMGTYASVVAAACLTLEYIGSASAVARGWGDKVVVYLKLFDNHDDDDVEKQFNYGISSSYYQLFIFALAPGHGLNFAAFLVSTGAVLLLLAGVKESKYVTNIVSSIKTMLILFIAGLSLALMKKDNFIPYIPPEFGTAGIIRGATSSFFGYVGFDEICCLSGEAINPKQNVPRAIIITLLIVTTLYVSASLGLSGMVPYQEISEASAFPDGFRYRGYNIAADFTAIGELAVLPLCVLVTIMAQPRLTYTMALDGILPTLFAELDEKNNLFKGTIISGIVMIIIATVVPFIHLDDIISSGILIAFTLTNTSVILVRCSSPKDRPYTLERLLIAFHLLSIVSGLLIKEITINAIRGLTLLSCIVSIIIVGNWIRKCPQADETNVEFYLTPAVPILPLCGCFVNILLITRMEFGVLGFLGGYIGLALLGHYLYAEKQQNTTTIGHGLNLKSAICF